MKASFQRRALALPIALALSSSTHATVLFSEDFQTRMDPVTHLPVTRCPVGGNVGNFPFPDGWLLRNVDNRQPDISVVYVNEAWEVRDDFQLDNTNCVAFSTSFYAPRGWADDWMWTPQIGPLPASGTVLSWRARAYDPDFPDGYEVRVMTTPTVPTGGAGAIGNQITNSTVVFTTAGESTSWSSHTVDLSAYKGQSVRIGFRNGSFDRFLLVLDDITVTGNAFDLAAQAAPGFAVPYARVPAGISVNANYNVLALNLGSMSLTNVAASAQPTLNGSAQGAAVTSGNVASLAVAASTTLAFADPVVLSASGTWGVTYTLSANGTASDDIPGNNVLQAVGTTIGGNEWARHEGAPDGTLGVGSGNQGELGTTFTLRQTATFEGARFAMEPASSPWPGQSVVAHLRTTDAAGKPDLLIATTVAITSSSICGVYDVKFAGGPQTLAPGTYFVGVVEPVAGGIMPLVVSRQRFVPGTIWVGWPNDPGAIWELTESFGSDFELVPNVSLLREVSLFKDDFARHSDSPAAQAVAGPAATTPATTRKRHPGTALAIPRR